MKSFWKIIINFEIKEYYKNFWGKIDKNRFEQEVRSNDASRFIPILVLAESEKEALEKGLKYLENNRSRIIKEVLGFYSYLYEFAKYDIITDWIEVINLKKTCSFDYLEKYAIAEDFLCFCRQEWERW